MPDTMLENSNAKNTKYKVSKINLIGSQCDIDVPMTPEVINVIMHDIKVLQDSSGRSMVYISSTY